MYSAVVHKTERLEISFSEDDYNHWKKQNPDIKHTHEMYVKDTALNSEGWSLWDIVDFDIVCIVYSGED